MARSKKKTEEQAPEERPVYDPRPQHGGVLILADDLRPGHVLLGRRNRVTVKQVDPCTHQWRTHVHVNRFGCYDGRLFVEVAR